MNIRLTPRLGYALGFAVCLALLGGALYLQYYQDQAPCPLCILQRVAFIGLLVVFALATLHGPGRIAAYIYGATLFGVAALGAAVAVRHLWLQSLPKSQVPECGPGLAYMLERFPLARALDRILQGSGECAEVGWQFLGLSLPGWALVGFVMLAAWAVLLTVLSTRGRGAGGR